MSKEGLDVTLWAGGQGWDCHRLDSVTLEGFSSLSGSVFPVLLSVVLPIHGCFSP